MILRITPAVKRQIETHVADGYPEEAAGLLLGSVRGNDRLVTMVMTLTNSFDEDQRDRRYLLTPEDMLQAEKRAEELGLDILGVFHSHPDHPARPSEYDRSWAWPWFIYLITSVQSGAASEHRAWQLTEDRAGFHEIPLQVEQIQEVS